MENKIFLSIVTPAYNEAKNLKRGVLGKIVDYLKTQKFSWEVIFVDDGSSDDTVKIIEKFMKDNRGIKLMKEPHRGKGGAIIAGILKARGKYVLFSDMDQSTPLNQLEKFLPKVEKGYDIVIGSRSGRPGQTIERKIMAAGWVVLRSLILRLPYKDTQCGFKLFKKEAAEPIFKKMRVYSERVRASGASVTAGFDLEVLYIARKLGYKVAEVPVEWFEFNERREVSPIKDSWEGFRDLVRVRMNALKGEYK